jgi:hypothetical protein
VAQKISALDHENDELTGRNRIFKVEFVAAVDRAPMTLLFKNISKTGLQNGRISTRIVNEFLGHTSYRIELYPERLSHEDQNVWEVIEKRASRVIARTPVDSALILPGISEFLSGTPEQVLARMRALGGIFAQEYLSARDDKMAHILLDEQRNLFRIDWDFMPFDSENPKIPTVLQGDERDFLKALAEREHGRGWIDAVVEGFETTITHVGADLQRGRDSEILKIVAEETGRASERFEKIAAYFQRQFHDDFDLPKAPAEIRREIGLVSPLEDAGGAVAAIAVAMLQKNVAGLVTIKPLGVGAWGEARFDDEAQMMAHLNAWADSPVFRASLASALKGKIKQPFASEAELNLFVDALISVILANNLSESRSNRLFRRLDIAGRPAFFFKGAPADDVERRARDIAVMTAWLRSDARYRPAFIVDEAAQPGIDAAINRLRTCRLLEGNASVYRDDALMGKEKVDLAEVALRYGHFTSMIMPAKMIPSGAPENVVSFELLMAPIVDVDTMVRALRTAFVSA